METGSTKNTVYEADDKGTKIKSHTEIKKLSVTGKMQNYKQLTKRRVVNNKYFDFRKIKKIISKITFNVICSLTSDNRLAITDPADPAPTIIKSYSSNPNFSSCISLLLKSKSSMMRPNKSSESGGYSVDAFS